MYNIRFVGEKKNRDRSERRHYTIISTRRYKRKIEMYTIARETSYYYRGNNLAATDCIIIIIVYIHNIILLYTRHTRRTRCCRSNHVDGGGGAGARDSRDRLWDTNRRTAAFIKCIITIVG